MFLTDWRSEDSTHLSTLGLALCRHSSHMLPMMMWSSCCIMLDHHQCRRCGEHMPAGMLSPFLKQKRSQHRLRAVRTRNQAPLERPHVHLRSHVGKLLHMLRSNKTRHPVPLSRYSAFQTVGRTLNSAARKKETTIAQARHQQFSHTRTKVRRLHMWMHVVMRAPHGCIYLRPTQRRMRSPYRAHISSSH